MTRAHIFDPINEVCQPLPGASTPHYLPPEGRFHYDANGTLWRRQPVKRGRFGGSVTSETKVAESVCVTSQGRTKDGKYWLYLNVKAADDNWTEVAVPWALIGSKKAIAYVRAVGGIVYADGERDFVRLLKDSNPPVRVTLPETVKEDAPVEVPAIPSGFVSIYHIDQWDGDWDDPDAPRH